MRLCIVDTKSANFNSVVQALKRLGVEATISADLSVLKQADKLIMPGVGSATAVMKGLLNCSSTEVILQNEQGLKPQGELIDFICNYRQPLLGICLGMQCTVIETARNLCGLHDANSTEFDPTTKDPVVDLTPQQKNVVYKGGTMRLGNYTADLEQGTLARKLYGKDQIVERHRHRYEFNPQYVKQLREAGLKVSAWHEGVLPEIVEREDHPYFIAVQFHPEFGSRPLRPHPLFDGLIKASLKQKENK